MNALKIKVYNHTGAPTDVFTAEPGNHMRAIIGKHGELRIAEITTHQDVDIETKKQIETQQIVVVIHSTQWSRYENGDV